MSRRAVVAVLLLFLTAGAVEPVWAGDLEAWLDRTRIAEGETVQLTLQARGSVDGRPDTAPLQKDFEVLGLSTGSQVNIVNGRTDVHTTWALTLSPRRSGTLAIPPLRVGDLRSDALTLEVSQASAPATDGAADILVETDVEPRDPYVQGQVLYTVRLLHAVPVTGGKLSEPSPDGALVQRLGEDRKYATTRNGRRYQVVERRYALFPQTSGTLSVDAPVFDGEIPDPARRRTSPFGRFFGNDPFFGRDPFQGLTTPTRRVRVRGAPATVAVKPRPDAAQGAHWLPAEGLELKGEWRPDSGGIRMGEPVTLVLDLDARGLTGGQLPSLAPEKVAGFKVYPDQAQRETDTSDTGVTGHLQQKIAFLPQRTGDLALPAIEVRWWDTRADRERRVTVPGRTIEVSPAAGRSAQATPAQGTAGAAQAPTADHTPAAVPARAAAPAGSPPTLAPARGWWAWLSVALAIGWALTVAVWWWRSRRRPLAAREESAPDRARARAGMARRRFLAACEAGDAATARDALLAWAAAHWPDDPPRGLEAVARRLSDAGARAELIELDRALYGAASTWNGTRLAACVRRLPEPGSRGGADRVVLAPLYPTPAHHPEG